MENSNIDKVINRFYSFLPLGNEYSDSVYDFKFNHIEQLAILKFLKEERILQNWGDAGKLILTKSGEEIVTVHHGIEPYLKAKEDERQRKAEIEALQLKKLKGETKLVRWQVHTYWPGFILGVIGGIYAIVSVLLLLVQLLLK